MKLRIGVYSPPSMEGLGEQGGGTLPNQRPFKMAKVKECPPSPPPPPSMGGGIEEHFWDSILARNSAKFLCFNRDFEVAQKNRSAQIGLRTPLA